MISQRQQSFDLYRSTTELDSYGVMSATPYRAAVINAAIFRNAPTHDYKSPVFETTEYVAITSYRGVKVGDILSGWEVDYLVKDLGDRGTNYQALYVDKLPVERVG